MELEEKGVNLCGKSNIELAIERQQERNRSGAIVAAQDLELEDVRLDVLNKKP